MQASVGYRTLKLFTLIKREMGVVKQKHIADKRQEQNLNRQRGSYQIIAWNSPSTYATAKSNLLKLLHGRQAE
jgi:hypothetical protein